MNVHNQDAFYHQMAREKLINVLMRANRWFSIALVIALCIQAMLVGVVAMQCHQVDGITLTGQRFQSYSLSCPGINGNLAPIHGRSVDWRALIRS
ncbi:hypothetical protein [Pusillimonas sp. T2]|uniref:hypothetical protein n=1 Tax=Pusillimonas sp. T2 TaxID=1548123 RepID=UPI001303ADA8|nr:hypothetical protein [Pusillimonas sp. T2]